MTIEEAKRIILDYYNTKIVPIKDIEEARKVARENGCKSSDVSYIEWARKKD